MKLVKLGLAGVAAIASMVSPVVAMTSNSVATSHSNTSLQQGGSAAPMLLAEVRNYCHSGESLFVSAETADYWVNICGGDLPHTYVGVNKHNGRAIRVQLDNYEQDGSVFEAINGNVSYLLVRDTPRGSFLTVTQGRRELLRQPVLRWE
ncbi:MAG TPA: hypothetical protein V6C78_06395 [Crinalium sp.]|jgi:hypothetical protein